MRAYTRRRKFLGEFAGTFFVVLFAAGFAQARFGILTAAIFYGAAYGACLAALGRISGGHFNPAVTIAHWVTRRFGPFDTLTYFVAQIAGAAAAAYALRALPAEVWRAGSPLGAPILAAGVTRGPAMLIEAAMTFALVLALWVVVVDRPAPRYWLAGLVSGTVIAAAVYLGAPYTGGAMNPARAFGPALAAGDWVYQPVYWIGPLAGAVAAASLYDLLFRHAQKSSPSPRIPQKTAA